MNAITRPPRPFISIALGHAAWIALVSFPAAASGSPFPSGEELREGHATFDRNEDQMLIEQTTQDAIIEWQDFSIGEGAGVAFIQPEDGAALNRVISEVPSEIQGMLEASGRVFLINPNGIVFSEDAVIDTQSFVASTLDVSDEAFMEGGDLVFEGASEEAIVNQGELRAEGGHLVLIARAVNQEGRMEAPDGTAALAAGPRVLLSADLESRIFVNPDFPEEENGNDNGDNGNGENGNGDGDNGDNGNGDNGNGDGDPEAASLLTSVESQLEVRNGNPYALAVNSDGIRRGATVEHSGDGRIVLSTPEAGKGEVVHSGEIQARDVALDGETGVRFTGSIEAEDTLSLRTEVGNVTQNAPFEAGTLTVSAGNNADLTHENNELSALGEVSTGGHFRLRDSLGELSLRGPLNAGGQVHVRTTGDLTLRESVSSGAEGDAIVLVAGERFINRAGSGALQTDAGGRWLVYAPDWRTSRLGGLLGNREEYGIPPPADIDPGDPPFEGSGFLFEVSFEEGRAADLARAARFHRDGEHSHHPDESDWRPYSRRQPPAPVELRFDPDTDGWQLLEPHALRSSSFTMTREEEEKDTNDQD